MPVLTLAQFKLPLGGYQLEMLALPNPLLHAERCMVFAPHPDDDVIGCGGTMARLAARGAACHVVCLTDGSQSHPNSKKTDARALARIREDETKAALRVLCVREEPTFLRLRDGSLPLLARDERDLAGAQIAGLLRALRPDVILCPWRRDVHSDHVAAAALLEDIAANHAGTVPLLFYAVWQPMTGTASDAPRSGESETLRVPLSAPICERKRAAICAHRSQTSPLIDDDPDGFVAGEDLIRAWSGPSEVFYR